MEDFLRICKSHHHKAKEDCDRINDLSDYLLISIISYLSGRELIATGLVSRRWRYLWHQTSQLNLDVSCELNQADFLLNVLCRHRGTLQKVHIATDCFSYDPISQWGTILNVDKEGSSLSDSSKSQSWLQCLREKFVSCLILDCNSVSYRFDPYEILGFLSLKELSLTNFYFIGLERHPISFGLRSLRLDSAHIDDENLETLIGQVTKLEHLCLSYCRYLRHPKIHSDILKKLEIENQVDISFLDIDAPKLTTLKLHELPELSEVELGVSALLTLDATNFDLIKLVYNNGAKHLNNAIVFRSLLKLTVGISLVNQDESVKWILRKCDSLRELCITHKSSHARLNLESTYLGDNETPSCLMNHLKYLKFQNFEGTRMELEFV